jgi:hypothetical protein
MRDRGCLSQAGPEGETLFPVDGSIFIGSSHDCEVRVKDAAPRQCQIVRAVEGFILIDLTGQKVTKVNGARIERHLLRDGEVVVIGSSEFRWTVTVEPEEEQVLVVATPSIRRRTPTSPVPIVNGEQKRRSFLFPAAAAAAVVVIVVLIVVFSSSSNADRSISRRDARPARSDSTPSSGAARETVPVGPSAPRQDPGGVAAAPASRATAEPAPTVIAPLPTVVPEMPAVKPEPGKAEPRARTPFEQRYAALLASLERTLARGWGYEATYKEILEFPAAGAPKGTVDHLKALAASLKDAVACRECSGGKVGCERCGGKGRVDQECLTCQGQGRVRAAGAVGDADVTVKCRNCDGKKVFKGVTCPVCARSGKATCAACKGKVWPDDRCPRPECNAGRMPCPTCGGKAVVMEKCPYCVNGRQKAPGAVNGADVTMKCRNCEIDGAHGTGQFKVDCKTCGKTGKVTCDHCGGAYNRNKPGPDGRNKDVATGAKPVSTAKVYTLEKCRDCSGAGCDLCFGLGSRVKPVRVD